MHPRDQYRAFILGDPLLATSAALATSVAPRNVTHRSGLTQPAVLALVAGLCLMFGIWQWREEVSSGVYSGDQAKSPTKLWHQFIVYPLIGSWLWAAAVMAAPLAMAHLVRVCAAVLLVGAWGALGAYDSRHMRLAHIPYDWFHLRPCPEPWAIVSESLRHEFGAAADQCGR